MEERHNRLPQSDPPFFNSDQIHHFVIALCLLAICYALFFALFSQRSPLPATLKSEFAEEFAIFWRPYDATSLHAAFTGPWIPKGTKESIRNFYRPFSISAYAGLYEMWGDDTSGLHRFLLYLTLLKFAALFGVFYLLAEDSLTVAFLGTLLYSISFKIFDEQIVLQDFPDLLLAILFFSALFFFILFTRSRKTALWGSIVFSLFLLGLGTKENGFFLFPTLLAYRFIFAWTSGNSRYEFVKRVFDRKYTVLFSLMLFISMGYFAVRYFALGADYFASASWTVSRRPTIVYSFINVLNNFALVPQTFVDHLFADDWMVTLLKIAVNLLLPVAALQMCTRRNVSDPIKKAILFCLTLIVLNTFFFTLGVRVRFNSIGTLGTMFLAVIVGQRIFHIAATTIQSRLGRVATYAFLATCVYLYITLNVWNILHRPHPFQPSAPLEVSIFNWKEILSHNDEKAQAIEQMNRLNAHAATFDERKSFSFFLLAVVLESEHRTLDCFDMCYRGMFRGSDAKLQLKIIESKAVAIEKLQGYRKDFALGLVNVAELILKTKQAYEEYGDDWATQYDMNEFRNQFQMAMDCFRRSGPIGEHILQQLEQVATKMDEDGDHQLSNDEIGSFITPKLKSPEANN
jgi:hypothetical protein